MRSAQADTSPPGHEGQSKIEPEKDNTLERQKPISDYLSHTKEKTETADPWNLTDFDPDLYREHTKIEPKNEPIRYIWKILKQKDAIYLDQLFQIFKDSSDPLILEILPTLNDQKKIRSYRKNGYLILCRDEIRKTAMGDLKNWKGMREENRSKNYHKNFDPDQKPQLEKDKDFSKLEISSDELLLLDKIMEIRRLLSMKNHSLIRYKDLKENKPKNWITYRLDITLEKLLRKGLLELKDHQAEEILINERRFNELRNSMEVKA